MGTIISIVSALVLLGILALICLLGLFLFKKITGAGDIEMGQKVSISGRLSALKDTLFFRIAFAGVLILISYICNFVAIPSLMSKLFDLFFVIICCTQYFFYSLEYNN